jgi:competence protein ComEC
MLTSAFKRESFLSRYPFLLLLVSLCTGISVQSMMKLKAMPCLLLTLIGCALAIILHRSRAAAARLQVFRITAIVISFGALGACLSALQDIRQHKSWYGHYLHQATALQVYIEEAPQEKERTILLPARVTSAKVAGHWIKVKGALRLYVYRSKDMPVYHSGQTLLIPAKLLPIKSQGNPFAFDYAAYAAKQGWYHQAFLPASALYSLKIVTQARPWVTARNKLRQCIAANVQDSNTLALIEATLLNERSALDEALWKTYSVTGIVHIIAISGMHIAMLAGMLLFTLRLLPFPKLRQLKYLVTIIAIWCYIALTGFPPSAVRAALMFTLMAIGLMLNRNSSPVNTWSAAGFLILCYHPAWLYDIGLQLSFLAVLSLLLFYKPVEKRCQPRSLWITQLWRVLAMSIAVQILVAPIVIYYFHQFPVMGLIANVPATVFSTLLMYGGMALLLLSLLNIPCLWLGKLLTWCTQGFHWLIAKLASCAPQVMQQLYIDRYEYWLMMFAITTLSLFLWYRKQLYCYAGCLFLLFLVADFIMKDIQALKQEYIVVYNIPHITLADIFKGKRTIAISSAEASSKAASYTLLSARLAFRATTIQSSSSIRLYRVRGATVLFLNTSLLPEKGYSFPVDFLIVSQQCLFDPEAWHRAFRPRKIIIDGSLPRWKAIQWKRQLEDLGAPVHWVQEDGAWIFPALSS